MLATLSCTDADDTVVSVSTVPMSFKSEDVEAATRAAFVTSMSSFGLSCSKYSSSGSSASAAFGNYFYDQEISNNAATKYYWPGSDYKCSFYAYYPYGDPNIKLESTTSSTGAPTYSLTVPTDISKQVDFCVAEVKDVAGNYEKKVTLPFSHACSSVSIKVENTGFYGLTLKSVKFYGVKLSGVYSGGTWSTLGNASTSTSNAMTVPLPRFIGGGETFELTGSSNKIIVIPQTIAADTEILDVLLEYEGEDKHYSYKLSDALTMKKGTEYSFTLSFDPHNGHPYVDLGLPSGLKWATCNVGANNPEDYGLYFAWGETTGYTAEQVMAGERVFDESSYTVEYDNFDLTLEQDAAHVNMGGSWRMPTIDEYQELIDNCTVTWTNNYNGTGVAGYVFTSKENDNSLFFPAAGQCNGSAFSRVGLTCYYWSSSIESFYDAFGYYLDKGGDYYSWNYARLRGLSVRGVSE